MNFLTDWLSSLGQSARDRTPPGPAIADRPQRLSFHEKPYQAPAYKPQQPQQPQQQQRPNTSSGYVPTPVVSQALISRGWTPPPQAQAPSTALPPNLLLTDEGYVRPSHNYMMSDTDRSMLSGMADELGAPKRKQKGSSWGNPAASLEQLELQGGETRVRSMTKEQFEALTPQQQNAVRFNTMLVQATQKDFKDWGENHTNFPAETREKFTAETDALFGEGRGSDVYAPNTVKLLKDLGINVRGADLDEFLSLERSLSPQQLVDFDEKFSLQQRQVLDPDQNNYRDERQFAAVRGNDNGLQLSIEAVRAAGQYLDTVMKNPKAGNPTIGDYTKTRYGGATPGIGWAEPGVFTGDAERRNLGFQELFAVLQDKSEKDPMDVVMTNLSADTLTDAQYNQFWVYVQDRLNYTDRTGTAGEGRSTAEIRELIGARVKEKS